MKIGLITFHNTANYGAALQTYALQHFLDINGYDSTYINYVNSVRRHQYDMLYHIFENIKDGKYKAAITFALGSPFMFLRKKRFSRFYNKYVSVTKEIYRDSVQAKSLNKVFDVFIVGSDQVWNPGNNGKDMAYLLDFVDDDKLKMSYSSSFGLKTIPSDLSAQYKKCLSRFDYLAVRETEGQSIIKELTGRDAQLVLDPVFLLKKEDWESFSSRDLPKEKYVFSYTNRPNQMKDFVRQTGFSMQNLKHYKLARNTNPSDFISKNTKVKYTMSPIDFLHTIQNAELVVTASFHCMALSIVLHKPFIAILIGDEGKDSRLVSLLKELNLENRIFTSQMTLKDVNTPINYQEVEQKLDEMRHSSIDYLMNSLKSH